jgi:DNA-binding HxlR family transcriptional regulator
MVTRRPGQPRSGCAINAAVEVIGDRWSLLVLRDVMFGNRRHFRVLQERSEEAIASNILANRLRRLVADGLLTRAQAGRSQRAEYCLTEAAIQLVPVMAVLGHWGRTPPPHNATATSTGRAVADGGPDLWHDFMAELRAEHLGTPLPPRSGPTTAERLAAAYAAALALETGESQGNDDAAHLPDCGASYLRPGGATKFSRR